MAPRQPDPGVLDAPAVRSMPMTRTGAVLVGLLVARCAAAATWACDQRVEMFTGQAYLVTARCTATGSYTSGGDPPGSVGMDLCNSAHRHPIAVLPTIAA